MNWRRCKTRCKEAQGRAKRMGVNLDRLLGRAQRGEELRKVDASHR